MLKAIYCAGEAINLAALLHTLFIYGPEVLASCLQLSHQIVFVSDEIEHGRAQ